MLLTTRQRYVTDKHTGTRFSERCMSRARGLVEMGTSPNFTVIMLLQIFHMIDPISNCQSVKVHWNDGLVATRNNKSR
jgi:hypothetical protein